MLKADNEHAGALAAYREGLVVRRTLAAKDPDNAQWQLDVLASLERIADVLSAQTDTAGATAAYREALDIARARMAKDPNRLRTQMELVYVLSKLGPLVEPASGRAMLSEALAMLEKLAQNNTLPAAQKNWPEIVRSVLSKLP